MRRPGDPPGAQDSPKVPKSLFFVVKNNLSNRCETKRIMLGRFRFFGHFGHKTTYNLKKRQHHFKAILRFGIDHGFTIFLAQAA